MKKPLCVFVFAVFFLSGIGLFAQNVQELRFGNAVSGNLNSGSEIWYSVRSPSNCFIVVETTGDTDTILELYDSQRIFIIEDDDSGEEYNARLEFYAASGSNYFIKLTAYGSEEGPFSILATTKPVPTATDLRFGASQSMDLSRGDNHWYRVRTTQSGIVVVETTGDLDTYLELYDGSYKYLSSDDDSGIGNNARVEIFVEPNQTYFLKLRGYDSSEIGPYGIMASFETIPADERNTERSRAVQLKLGEGISVFFRTSGESRWYKYDVTRANTNFIVQTRGGLDTYMYLYDSRGSLISENDDSGEGYNALISEKLDVGTYYIEIKELDGKVGRCTLHTETR